MKFKILFYILFLTSALYSQDYKVEQKTYKENYKKYTLKVTYPQIDGIENEKTERDLNAYLKVEAMKGAYDFKKSMIDWVTIMPENKSEFEAADTILLLTNNLISVKYNGYEYYS